MFEQTYSNGQTTSEVQERIIWAEAENVIRDRVGDVDYALMDNDQRVDAVQAEADRIARSA